MNQPDIILLAHMNNHNVLAVNFWGEGQVSKPEPGTTDDLPTVIRHFRAEGYCGPFTTGWLPFWLQRIVQWLHARKIIGQYIVRQGFDVSKADKVVSEFLEQVRATSV